MLRIRRALALSSASILTLALAVPVAAQTPEPQPAADAPQSAEAEAAQSAETESNSSEQEVVVTGSRIARPEFAFPNPIQSFTSQSLEQSGETNITDFLVDTPALVGSATSSDTSGSNGFFESAGLNLLNLRNLGTARTLVLLNGRRHVAGFPGTASVDINTFPTDLIERIDILTGGTSAIYGADGVSGVVNFVLKRNFDGINLRGQSGISQRGDAGNRLLGVTAGKNFSGGKGNITLSYEFNQSDRLNDKDRAITGDPFRRFELLRQGQPGSPDVPDILTVPDRVLFNNVRWADSSPDGAVDFGSIDPDCGVGFVVGCFDAAPEFTGSGGVYDRGIILPGSGGRTIGGSGTPTAGYFGDFQPYLRRHNANLLAQYEFSRALRVFAEGKYVDTKAFTISQPTFDFGTYLTPDNAYLQQRFGTGPLTAQGALVNRDNLDFGIRGDRSRRETWRGVIGIDGRINDHFRYELSYNYGQVKNTTTSLNDRLADRYYAALDAVVNPANGQITCRINLPGQTIIDPNNYGGAPVTFTPGQCQPLTILGQANQSGLDFVLATHDSKSKISQEVVSGFVSGDFGAIFTLPGGPIGFALGGEYRREKSSQNPSDLLQNGLLLDSAQIAPAGGKFSVKEGFAELNVPILKDMAFAHVLSVGAAIRLSDYSTVGSTTTWKVDGAWAPVRDITFRGTYSKAVRAPNISELFDPASGTFQFITDPCDIANRTSGSSFRVANCQAQLAAAGLTPAQIAAFSPSSDGAASTSQPGTSGGNPNLDAETARTWTAGVVLRPSFIPNLTISGDWYDIKLKNAISFATASELFALCVDQPTLTNVFCDNISRAPGTGFGNGFNVVPQNVAAYTTSGFDFQVNYLLKPNWDWGTFNFRVVGGYLNDLTFIGTPGADPDQDRGEQSAPKYIGVLDVTWTKGPLSINYGLAYQDETRRFTVEQLAANPDLSDPRFFYYKERWEHDLQLAWNVAGDRLRFYAGVNNLTDEKPSVSSGGNYPYSAIGRYFYAGFRAKLGGFLK